MNLTTLFERLGMPKHSATLYTYLSRHGAALAGVLAHKTHLHRPAVYRALRALLREKFIRTEKQGRRQLYVAASASLLSARFKSESSAVDKLAASLTHSKDTSTVSLPGGTKIFFLSGEEAISEIFLDAIRRLKHGEILYRYTSEQDLSFVNRHLPPEYRRLRDQKKIDRLVISNPASANQKRPRLERFIRMMPQGDENFRQNIIQLIYGSRVALLNLSTLEGFIIEHQALADFQRTIFKTLYKKLDPS
jgi:sugar-specific transcriptional regulator TrmB